MKRDLKIGGCPYLPYLPTFAWLQFFRHLVVRYDRYLVMYAEFYHLARVILVLRKL